MVLFCFIVVVVVVRCSEVLAILRRVAWVTVRAVSTPALTGFSFSSGEVALLIAGPLAPLGHGGRNRAKDSRVTRFLMFVCISLFIWCTWNPTKLRILALASPHSSPMSTGQAARSPLTPLIENSIYGTHSW